MIVETADDRGTVFVCPESGCGRRLLFDSVGALSILHGGNPEATHLGASGPFSLTLGLSQDG